MYPKKWFQSKTIWLSVAQVLATGLTYLTYFAHTGLITDPKVLATIMSIEVIIGEILKIINRFNTNQPVKF